MELITLLIGMILAFILGAYVRQPFTIVVRHQVPRLPLNDKNPVALDEHDDELEAEKKRMAQIKNLWDYVGKEQPHGRE